MNGTYRFYQDGRLLRESKNLLTTEGKRAILRFLAGRGGSIGSSIALGTGVTPATVNDSRLTFEADRVTIDVISVLYNDSLIVFKGTIPQEIEYSIYEAGVFNMPSNPVVSDNPRIIATFDDTDESWSNGTIVVSNARAGTTTLRLQPNASGTLEAVAPIVADFSGFTVDDNFTVAITKGNTNASSIILKFKDLAGNQFALTKSISALALGYNVVTFRKGDFVATGAIDWSNISYMTVSATATSGGQADVYFDAVRVEDDDAITGDYALLSRSVLQTPLIKSAEAPMDVEYALELNFA